MLMLGGRERTRADPLGEDKVAVPRVRAPALASREVGTRASRRVAGEQFGKCGVWLRASQSPLFSEEESPSLSKEELPSPSKEESLSLSEELSLSLPADGRGAS